MAKSSRSSKKVISRSKKPTSRTKFSYLKNKLIILAGLALVIALGFKTLVSFVAQPAGVNEVANSKVAWVEGQKQGSGCYEKQVQCVKAPCEPVLVCPPGVSPIPTPQVCTQDAGSCLNSVGECVGYTDRCQRAKMCGKDFRRCDMTKPTPTPVASPISCSCPPGARCKMDARCSTPTPKPTPTPTPIATSVPTTTPAPSLRPSPIAIKGGLSSFVAKKSCGGDSYLYITFSCNNQKNLMTIADNTCTDIYSAMKKATLECGGVSVQNTDTGRSN